MHNGNEKGPPAIGRYPPDALHYLQAQVGPPGPRGPPGILIFFRCYQQSHFFISLSLSSLFVQINKLQLLQDLLVLLGHRDFKAYEENREILVLLELLVLQVQEACLDYQEKMLVNHFNKRIVE